MIKKAIYSALIIGLSSAVLAQDGKSFRKIEDPSNGTTSCTNYVGIAITLPTKPSPSENDPVWKIIRTIYDENGIQIDYRHAYSSEGYNALYSTAWTNRFSATYK